VADSTRRVSLDDAARVKAELREVGETGSRSLARIQDGAERASRGLDSLDAAVRGIQVAGVATGIRAPRSSRTWLPLPQKSFLIFL
jgi:hypothetical protein